MVAATAKLTERFPVLGQPNFVELRFAVVRRGVTIVRATDTFTAAASAERTLRGSETVGTTLPQDARCRMMQGSANGARTHQT